MNQSSVPAFTLPREFRASWVATVANIDWPSKPGLPNSALRAEMAKILDTAQRMKLNAIIFQVRPSADALYQSSYEPWSWYLTGEQGKAPADGFDPLAWTIAEAHKRGIELHVWLNPYRALHPAQGGPAHSSHITQANPEAAPVYGKWRWMDPGQQFVQERSFNVFMELVEKYDLDGIHIDDYFYPYPERENGQVIPFPDRETFAQAVAEEPGLTLDVWRRRNVNRFVERVYRGIKERKPWVKFGISPFGIYRPGIPEGIRAGVDQYAELYADAKLWLEQGWCDYFTPQLYWPIAQTPQSFPKLLDWWHSVNPKGRHLWPGLFTSRTNPAEGNWNSKEVLDQISLIRQKRATHGEVHFSFKSFLQNWNGVATALEQGPYRTFALPPATPWLDSRPPAAPESVAALAGDDFVVVRTKDPDVRFATVSVLRRGRWELARIGSPRGALKVAGLEPKTMVRVSLIDRAGNEGPARVVRAVR